MTTNKDAIRLLNDTMRRTLMTGRVMLTEGIMGLSDDDREAVITKVREFEAFTSDNDPHQEHDFGACDHNDVKYFWKIDYYNLDCSAHSDDPADPRQTCRVLTIMRADEY